MTRRRATEMAEMSLREINEYEYKKNTHDCMYYRIPVGRMSDRCNGSPRVCVLTPVETGTELKGVFRLVAVRGLIEGKYVSSSSVGL